jgi:hypothetical protein
VRTALVVAVPEAEPLVGPARSRYDLADKTGIPAHITILFPFGDREDGLDELFARFPPFDFALVSVRRWPTVLWLAPEPSEPFVALTNAVADRYPEYPPYGGEHDEVIPHLTVGHRATDCCAGGKRRTTRGVRAPPLE